MFHNMDCKVRWILTDISLWYVQNVTSRAAVVLQISVIGARTFLVITEAQRAQVWVSLINDNI